MMNVKETAVFLRVSERMVRLMANRRVDDPRRLPSYRIGSRLVFDQDEIREFLRKECKG
jgi:hypothetical protein